MRFSRLAVLPFLLTACASPRPAPSIPVDTVEPPAEAVSYSVLIRDRLHLEGAARWQTATVGEVIQRASVTDADRQRAERVLASGAYLDDPQGVVRLTDTDVTEQFQREVKQSKFRTILAKIFVSFVDSPCCALKS